MSYYEIGEVVGGLLASLFIQILLGKFISKVINCNDSLAVTIAAILSVPIISTLYALGDQTTVANGFKTYALTIILAWAILFFTAYRSDKKKQSLPASEMALAAVFVVTTGLGLLLVNKSTKPGQLQSTEQTIEQFILDDVASIIPDLPMEIDSVTTLVRVMASGRSIIYFYEVKRDSKNLEQVSEGMRENIITGYCNDPETYIHTVPGFVAKFNYSPDDSDVYLLNLSISKADCPSTP